MADSDRLALIANLAASYLRRNPLSVDQIGSVISSVTRALDDAAKGVADGGGSAAAAAAPAVEARPPAVPISQSVKHDYIVCLEDGMKLQTLKRHLQAAYGMTPQQYREKWHLPKDYPMTAPAYSERRSAMAKSLGLGRKGSAARAEKAKRGRKRGS